MRTLRRTQVADRVGVHKQTIWRWVKQGAFPKPFYLNEHKKVAVWDEATIDNWLEKRKEMCHESIGVA